MRLRLCVFLAALSFAASSARATVITDGDFDDWAFSGTGTVTTTREASDGHPGARINVTTVSGPTVYGIAVKRDFTSTQALSGVAFTMALDVLSGPGAFDQGQAIALIAFQNGTAYAHPLRITGFPRNWDTLTFDGAFDAATFVRLSGAGPASPSFDGSLVTRFGFAAGNSNSLTLTQYYDNFTLRYVAPSSEIPEPGSCALVLLSLVAASRAGRPQRGDAGAGTAAC